MSLPRRVAASIFCFLLAGLLLAQSDAIENWLAPPYWLPQKVDLTKSSPDVGTEGLEPQAVEGVPTPALAVTGIAPCRIVDTRGNGFTDAYGPPALIAGAPRNFTLTGQCGIAGASQAVSLNVTVTNTQGPGHIVIYPQGGVQPTVSTLNYVAGQTIANAAVVPLGTGGGVTVIAGVSGTDLIIDTNGYYAPQTVVNTVNSLSGAVTLDAGSNISITPSGQTLTIASTAGGPGWSLTGNGGTTPGTNFLGTTDNQALELKVNGSRAFRLEPTATSPNVIAGWPGNSVTTGTVGATVSGGGGVAGGSANRVTDDHGTVSGGANNRAGDNSGTTDDKPFATVGGGSGNVASGFTSVVAGGIANSAGDDSAVTGGFSNDAQCCRNFVGGGENNTAGPGSWITVAGGHNNTASLGFATVGGGSTNSAINTYATVGGGNSNTANGLRSTIPGGDNNLASGQYSFAAGRRAQATHQGSFVWGDSTDADVGSAAVNQFTARATGGFRFHPSATVSCTLTDDTGWQCVGISDRNLKREIAPVDVRETLERLLAVPIQTWSYSNQNGPVRHIGPMAQDFAAAYALGADDKTINPVDANGVALASIQALYELVKEKDVEIEALKTRLSKLEAEVH